MKQIAVGILFVAALAVGSGCARPDWIEQTLVTVNVTGIWEGSTTFGSSASGSGSTYEFSLQQDGPTVKGSVRGFGPGNRFSGLIEGTVAGDVFSFRQTNGSLKGELTVSGDEMTGEMTAQIVSKITLRRAR